MREDWVECILDDLLVFMTNGSSAKQFEEEVGLPISRIETIWDEKIDFNRVKYVKESEPEFIEKYRIIKNDILLSHINSDSHLGKTAIFKDDKKFFIHGINLLKLRPSPQINADLLLHQFRFKKIKGDFIAAAQRAVNQSSINQRKLKAFEFILPSLAEQRAIVAKIEALFSDLDKGIADLKTAQAQLKVYRQAVLKKAFEGELTKEWREQQTDLPTADEFLEQIKEERQKHYEQQIENWKEALKAWEENGKEGKKPGKPKKLKYFDISVDVYGKLPESYKQFTWFSLGNLFIESPQNGLYEPASKYGSGTSIIRIDSFYDGHILNNEEFKRVELSKSDIKRYSLNENEILVNRVNSIEYLGKCGLVKQLNETTVFESNIMRLKILNSCINSQYITLFLSSVLGEREIRGFAKHAVNQASINQTDVSLTPIPICTLEEQEQVVKEVSTCLSVCEKVEESITVSLVKAKALRQSILKKAFEGTLLSEEEIAACKAAPDYEPASVLLEKIKAEKKKK